ncbi:MAG: DUF559 domain-containing protein [Bacteroidia bacterium]|nr:DUF559 domain-containing protein [Bacteroidia bacterium]
MKTKYYNVKSAVDNRKYLRGNLTPAEAVLWRSLKNPQLEGRRFRRQFSVGDYILGFYCPSEKLTIELDGAHHFTVQGLLHDEKRDTFLKNKGITIIRIENQLVFDRHEDVLLHIKEGFKQTPLSSR